jgi:hypothetical protein
MLYQSGRGVEPKRAGQSELANKSGGKIRQTRPITLTVMVGRVRMRGGF